jgi:hypothetical protein
VLATRRDMEKLVRGADPRRVFPGWRGELLGPLLAELSLLSTNAASGSD